MEAIRYMPHNKEYRWTAFGRLSGFKDVFVFSIYNEIIKKLRCKVRGCKLVKKAPLRSVKN